jgi:hypothetical protein
MAAVRAGGEASTFGKGLGQQLCNLFHPSFLCLEEPKSQGEPAVYR